MKACIFAHTGLTPQPPVYYPEFISINTEDGGEHVEVTVRSLGEGDASTIVLTASEFAKLAHTIYSYACTGAA